jgi:hypothetical protein
MDDASVVALIRSRETEQIERVGIQLSRARLAQNGNPPLEIIASVGAVAVVVRTSR